jgi:hypothetical protein
MRFLQSIGATIARRGQASSRPSIWNPRKQVGVNCELRREPVKQRACAFTPKVLFWNYGDLDLTLRRATRARSGQFIRGAAAAGVWAAKGEPCHIRFAAPVLSMMRLGHCWHEDRTMKARRMVFWWFRFVVSGRFLEKFLNSRRARR